MRTVYNYDYERYSPYFNMVYNYEGDLLKMTPEVFLMWLESFMVLDTKQRDEFFKNFWIFISGKDEEVR